MVKKLLAGVLIIMSLGLFARCDPRVAYTAIFNSNGGEGHMESIFVSPSQDGFYRRLPHNEFTKEGYESLCWSLDSEGTILLNFRSSSHIQDAIKKSKKDTVELFAVWTTPDFEFAEVLTWNPYIVGYNGTATDIIVPAFAANSEAGGVNLQGFRRDHLEKPLFENREDIISVSNIPGKNVLDSLFFGCANLQTVEFRNEIRKIGSKSFYNCVSIERFVIPASVTFIGREAFYGWTENQVVEFLGHPKNISGDGWFDGSDATIVIPI